MNSLLRLIQRSFARLLRAYPPRFRDEFEDEMEADFNDLIKDTAKEGLLSLLAVWLWELVCLPLSVLTEIRHESTGRQTLMDTGFQTIPEDRTPGAWKDALLAATPHLILAGLVAATAALENSLAGTLSTYAFIFLLFGGFLGAIYLTWSRRWPAWGASWYGYAALIVLIFATLGRQGWNPPISTFLNAIGSFALLAITLLTLRYWLSRRDPVEGLLIALPVVILYWFPTFEFMQNTIKIWLIFALFLVSALAAMLILRTNDVHKGVWVLLGASILGGLPLAIARTYFHTIPVGHFQPPSLFEAFSIFSVQFLAGAALAFGPILGWGLWNFGKKADREGRWSAGFLISGMILNLLGQYNYFRWYARMDYFDALGLSFLAPDREWALFMVTAGWILTVAGSIWLAILTWKTDRLSSFALTLTALALPVFAMLPVYFGFHIYVPFLPFDAVTLEAIPRTLFFTLAILLLAFGAWTISRLPFEGPQQKDSA